MRGRGKGGWWGVIIEAPDAGSLARFYSQVLGWPIVHEEPKYVIIAPPDTVSYIGFNTSAEYVRPVWPPVEGSQQMMMHVDVEVDDLEAAVAAAIELGATAADFQPQDNVRVMLDPAGHPFCLYRDEGEPAR
jgi:catechol 2,3-dioxygenase-like lactoylglutathione lyase family enzyme